MGTGNKLTVVLDKKTLAHIEGLAEQLGLKDEDILKLSITSMLEQVKRERIDQASGTGSDEPPKEDE